MRSFGRFGFPDVQPPARSTKPRIKSDLEKAQERIEELNQAIEGHEARIEHLETCIRVLCEATGVNIPEPTGL